MQDWHAPDAHLKNLPGKWRGEIGWPPRNVANTTLYLYDAHALSVNPAKQEKAYFVTCRAWESKRDSGGRVAHRPAPGGRV